jgi:hypothetical protein
MNPTTYDIILTAAMLGYQLNQRDAQEILALFTGESITEAIRDYFAAYEC